MALHTRSKGSLHEEEAARFLSNLGYKILKRNYRTRLGEIDIIAEDRGIICFIEVKSRSSRNFGLPEDAVNAVKQRHIAKVALCYLKSQKKLDCNCRFDVVCIEVNQVEPIRVIKNAFDSPI